MLNNHNTQILVTEIFPVKLSHVPTLHSYRLDIRGGDKATIGGKLAYRLKRTFAGHWAWAGGLIVTDEAQAISEILKVVETLWSEQPETFRGLRNVTAVSEPSNDPRLISEFAARGLLADVERKVQDVLARKRQDLGKAIVERVHEIRSWVVDGSPAVSLSVSSRLVLKQDLKGYAATVIPESLIGLQVADKTSTLKGEVIEIAGTLSSERQRLLAITQREEMQEILLNSPDSDLVLTISNGRNEYDYAISALRIILYTEYLRRFGIDSRKALNSLRIEPELRAGIIKDISPIMTDTGYVERAYNSTATGHLHLFTTRQHTTQVKFGNGSSVSYNEQTILTDLRSRGIYRVANKYKNGNPIRVGFLNALENQPYQEFWGRIEGSLRSLGFTIQKFDEIKLKEASRAELDSAVTQFQNQEVDILVAFFPDDFADEDDDEKAYHHFKSLTVGRGISSQVIEESTLLNEKALSSTANNIVLGVLAKTGNVPYVLAQPLSFADMVVGIDIARSKKKHLAGSMNATAITRVYLNDGEFLQYAIHDAPLEGETIPSSVLQSLFPRGICEGKRIIIHRDGYFRGDEKRSLLDWASKINAKFGLVEVIKTGSPRIYAIESSKIVQPQKGSTFTLNNTEAIVISSLPPFKNATPLPLRIRTEAPLSIEQAIESVLTMTNLHYGSVRAPRLPVTIHFSDKIAGLALRGIKPKNLEGTVPFWL